MEFLDRAAAHAGGDTSVFKAEPSGMRPMLEASRFGRQIPQSSREGVYLVNHWDKPALDVSIQGARFGRYSIAFRGPNRLAKEDEACFFAVEISDESSYNHSPGTIFETIRKWQESADDWAFKLRLSIVYRDFENTWYKTVCLLEPDPSGTGTSHVTVQTIGQELIDMPD